MTTIRALAIVACVCASTPVTAQSFSCNIGGRPACLDFGDTVCSSSGKCVNQSAQCFDRFQCDLEGFTCRSNVTDCVEQYETLLRTHNDLVGDHNTLLDENDRLRDDLRAAVNIMRDQEDTLGDIQTCLIFASSLADAQLCTP